MGKNTLNAIIRIEREIRKRITHEQHNAEECLAEVLRTCNDDIAREEARLQEELAEAVSAASLCNARKRGEALVAEAQLRAAQLAGLEDEYLRHLISGELPCLVPGKKS